MSANDKDRSSGNDALAREAMAALREPRVGAVMTKQPMYAPGSKEHRDALYNEAAQKIAEYRQTITNLRVMLMRCEDYFEERADAEYIVTSAGAHGNEEMGLLCEIRETLRRSS